MTYRPGKDLCLLWKKALAKQKHAAVCLTTTAKPLLQINSQVSPDLGHENWGRKRDMVPNFRLRWKAGSELGYLTQFDIGINLHILSSLKE